MGEPHLLHPGVLHIYAARVMFNQVHLEQIMPFIVTIILTLHGVHKAAKPKMTSWRAR